MLKFNQNEKTRDSTTLSDSYCMNWAGRRTGSNFELFLTLIGKFPKYEPDRFLGNSSKIKHLVEKWYFKNFEAWHRPISGKLIQTWMNFPNIGPAQTQEIEISKKYWTSLPEIRLCHTPVNWNFGKISGWVFQDLPIRFNLTDYCHDLPFSW